MKKLSEEIYKKIKNLYLDGYSYGKIADTLGIPKSSVSSIIKNSDYYVPNRKGTVIKKSPIKEYDSQIIELYKSGKSTGYIGNLLGFNRESIRYRLKIHNIPRREKLGIKHSIRNPTISLEFFKKCVEEDPENFDYFIGLFASDGNVYKNIVRIGGIADENIEFLEHWCKFLKGKLSIHRRLRCGKESFYSDVTFKNIDIVEYFSNFGIVPNKTFIIQLSYINWDVIRGLFDGDGCLVKDKRCNSWKFEIVTASDKLAQQLQEFYKNNGLTSHINYHSGLYKVKIGKRNDLIKIFKLLYKDSSYFLKRKYDKFLPIIQETD